MKQTFIIGNGESRKGLDLDSLREKGKIYGCNALYRDFTPDVLVAVDEAMMFEIVSSGYQKFHQCYFRHWNLFEEGYYEPLVGEMKKDFDYYSKVLRKYDHSGHPQTSKSCIFHREH